MLSSLAKVLFIIAVPLVGILVFLFYPYLYNFFFRLWQIIPRFIKDRKKPFRLFGIYGFVGDVGSGKTMSMVYHLQKLRKKYGNKIYITTNFYYDDEDFHFSTYEDLLTVRDKPLVVAWDEIQNEFPARDFSKFPPALTTLLTQNRKMRGVRIYWTAQRCMHVDKYFRDLTNKIYFCGTLLGCFSFGYGVKSSLVGDDGKPKKRPIVCADYFAYVQNDSLRDCYDSYQILQSARNKGYGSE